MRSIASKLGVTNLLEGSVRKSGSELRITAQLIRASDGAHLWSESYARKLTDIFALQLEISDTVAKALQATLGGAGKPGEAETTSVSAYNVLLKGDFILERSNSGDEDLALAQYRSALAIDPKYVRAWIRVAEIYRAKADSNELSGAEASAEVRKALQHALAIDPDSAAAHRVLGNAYQYFDWDWVAARSEFVRAGDLDPNGPQGRGAREDLEFLDATMTGRFDDSIRSAERDMDRNPLDPVAIYDLGAMQFFGGKMQDAAVTFQRLLELVPTYREAPSWYADTLLILGRPAEALAAARKETHETDRAAALARILWVLGRRAESEALLRQLERAHAGVAANQIARAYAYRGDADNAFRWLDRAFDQHETVMQIIKADPFFAGLRGDRRYRQLLRKMKLPEG